MNMVLLFYLKIGTHPRPTEYCWLLNTCEKKEVIYLCLICCGIVSFLLEQIHLMIMIDSLGHIKSFPCYERICTFWTGSLVPFVG